MKFTALTPLRALVTVTAGGVGVGEVFGVGVELGGLAGEAAGLEPGLAVPLAAGVADVALGDEPDFDFDFDASFASDLDFVLA